MSDLDSALLKIAKTRLVTEYLEALGSTPEQAATAARGYADQFGFSGAVLTFKGAHCRHMPKWKARCGNGSAITNSTF